MANSSKTDLEALRQMPDREIDYSDIPELDDAFFDRAVLRIPAAQAKWLVKLDPDVLAWFQAKGPDYPTVINSVLREHIAEQ